MAWLLGFDLINLLDKSSIFKYSNDQIHYVTVWIYMLGPNFLLSYNLKYE